MFPIKFEKRLLQIIIIILCLVPIIAGGSGAYHGAKLLGGTGADLDSHFRYLSGLLLGIGLTFLTLVPNLEKHSVQFRLLIIIVVIGGIARLLGLLLYGTPSTPMIIALAIELVIVPLLYFWQQRIAKLYKPSLSI